jgi:pimeloyl-ACP methyl ester carboxylesterase
VESRAIQHHWIFGLSRLQGLSLRSPRDVLSCLTSQVHEGYQQACGLNVDAILKDIEAARRAYPGYKVVVTGHSLGGEEYALLGTRHWPDNFL